MNDESHENAFKSVDNTLFIYVSVYPMRDVKIHIDICT